MIAKQLLHLDVVKGLHYWWDKYQRVFLNYLDDQPLEEVSQICLTDLNKIMKAQRHWKQKAGRVDGTMYIQYEYQIIILNPYSLRRWRQLFCEEKLDMKNKHWTHSVSIYTRRRSRRKVTTSVSVSPKIWTDKFIRLDASISFVNYYEIVTFVASGVELRS